MLRLLAAALFLAFAVGFFPAGGAASAATAPRFTQQVEAATFQRLADEKVEALLAELGETRRHEVMLVKPPRDMRLPPGEVTFSAEAPVGLAYNRRTPIYVTAYVDGKPYRRALCYYSIHVYDTVLVAARNIFPESPISEADLRFEERDVSNVRGRPLTDKGEAVGHVVNRLVQAGTLLSENLIKNPIVVESGSHVLIVSHYNGIEVRVSGIALGRGRVGQKIRVRNAASRKVMLGRVVDSTTVELEN